MQKKASKNDLFATVHNKDLKNLRGEKWKEIPFLEGYYLISNYGRVKSLPRLIEVFIPSQQHLISYYTKEKILTVKVHEKWNTIAKEPYFDCTISICFDGKERTFMISRLVYDAFVKRIDFEKDRLMVMHKDGNGLNNHYTNLISGTRKAVTQRSYDKNRHVSPFATKTKKDLKAIYRRAAQSRQKPVIQLTLKGKKVGVFKSIKEASLKTGIPDSNISGVLKGRLKTTKGYTWKYYN